MNDHEAERIAAAMHQLRPDWPAASVLTLIRSKLIDRPRRDVTVALAWIACESKTCTPARVLETGPWWKAAGAEGGRTERPAPNLPPWCKNCGNGQGHAIHSNGGCEFSLWPHQIEKLERQRRLAEVRAIAAEHQEAPRLVAITAAPEHCATEACIRGAGHTGPHQGPPEQVEPA